MTVPFYIGTDGQSDVMRNHEHDLARRSHLMAGHEPANRRHISSSGSHASASAATCMQTGTDVMLIAQVTMIPDHPT